jgi:hypothetical protein
MGAGCTWANTGPAAGGLSVPAASTLEEDLAARWNPAALAAGRPRFQPAAVSDERAAVADEDDTVLPVSVRAREGRYGSVFGETVHRAIGRCLASPELAPADAIRAARERTGLVDHLDEAAADVQRALDALRREGLLRALGSGLRVEYPIAGSGDGGRLLVGYIDLVGASAERLDVIDFKTDQPPAGPVAHAYPQYVTQVRTYGRLLEAAGLRGARTLRCGLLFAADGQIRWV